MVWTSFWDMHSGGGLKEDPISRIYIEAPEDEAKLIFQDVFGHDPEYVTCDCCGGDYAIDEEESLTQATGYDRGCAWSKDGNHYIEAPRWGNKHILLNDYVKLEHVRVIDAEEIKRMKQGEA